MTGNRLRKCLLAAAAVVVVGGAALARERVLAPAPRPVAGDPSRGAEQPAPASNGAATAFASEEDRARWTLRVLSEGFAREERDEAWAPGREAALHGVREYKRFPEGALLEAECRSAICRLTLTLPPGSRMIRANDLLLAPQLGEGGFYGPDPDRPGTFLFFVGREGTALQEHPYFVRAVASL
jgi:hypothetical protein